MGRFNAGIIAIVGPRITSCQLLSLPIVGRALVAHWVVGICFRCMLVFLSLPVIGREISGGSMCFLGWTILDASVLFLCGASKIIQNVACMPPHPLPSHVLQHPHPSKFRTLSEPVHPTPSRAHPPYVFQNPHPLGDPTPTQFILHMFFRICSCLPQQWSRWFFCNNESSIC